MALSWKQCLLLMIVSSQQLTNSASTYPEVCACKNNAPICQRCSYSITLKNEVNKHQISISCNAENISTQATKYANETFTEVAVGFEDECKTHSLKFDFPALDTYLLNFRNGNISTITINVKSENLWEIDLSLNKLQCIPKGLFNNFTNLRKLSLNKNEIVNILEASFDGLSKLESLDLSENNLTILANVFTPLKNLQHLNLSTNNIEFIHENYFNNWLLQHLDVSHNKLRKLAPGALQLLPNLARLLMTDNPLLGNKQLDAQLLVGTGRRLQQIDVSRIGLYQVPEAFTHSVRFLSLVGNRITAVRCGDFDSYPLLQSLDFSNNKVTSIEEDSLGRLEMLLFLNINKNSLSSVPKSLPGQLKYLSISNNKVQNLTVTDFKNLPALRILLLQHNEIKYIENRVFDGLLSLEMLDLSNNPIQILSTNTFDGPLSLRDLRLCYLNLSVLEQDGSFPMSSPESLQMLHLQSSPGLARQLLADSAALAAFSHLQYLDLRMNNLSTIRNDLLFYLGQLKTLRLYGNSINCSAKTWLNDWMNSNKTMYNGETCYYSTPEAKAEIAKYNCTFPETFAISENLPPVNLYSTEMINKLLRYYGYLNNKNEKIKPKKEKHFSFTDKNVTETKPNDYLMSNNDENSVTSQMTKKDNLLLSRNDNKILINEYVNETTAVKARESFKVLDQNKLQNDQFSIDHKFLDIEPNYSVNTKLSKKTYYDDTNQGRKKNRSGVRLNTPVNMTKQVYSRIKGKNVSRSDIIPAVALHSVENISSSDIATGSPDKTVYSPYQSTRASYARYWGTLAVSSLIVMSLILWASFRLRYRRRRVPVIDTEAEDQIEVSNISGGVLW